jgi:hypothetical protein
LEQFLSRLAELLLIIALPIVIAAAAQHFRAMVARLRAESIGQQQTFVDLAVRTAVRAAEQIGLWRDLIGVEKKEYALQAAQRFLHERGIQLDVNLLSDLIEAEVLRQFNQPTPPADTAEARQALILRTVEAAVLAAEQSGLKGHIENAGPEKKAYAIRLATQMLEDAGIRLDDEEMLSGLIEAQLLRLVLAARGQLPGAPVGGPLVPQQA